LKAARAAEADAANKLRAKLDPLPLNNGLTIAQAVAADKTLENALDRALVRARTRMSNTRARIAHGDRATRSARGLARDRIVVPH
jgi:hypothetical protein